MPKERYFRLQELRLNTFNIDAPVEIEKGALLLDKETKSVLLQLKNNILIDDFKLISSVRILINGFDDAGDEIEDFCPYYYTFRDINILAKKTFGDRTAIVLDPKVRKVNVAIDRVVFVNGTTWENDNKEISHPKQRNLNTLSLELQEQWEREKEVFTARQIESLQYFPQQFDEYWVCSCGRPNANETGNCARCGISKIKVFRIIDEPSIQMNLDVYNENKRIENEKKRQREEEQKRLLVENQVRLNKRNKTIRNSAIILFGISVISLIILFVVIPAIKYNQASNSLANKDFDTAIYLFNSLGKYKNSEDMVLETNYQKANELLVEELYDDAITTFSYITNYKNSAELISESNYQKGMSLLTLKKFDEALDIFSSIGDYKDTRNLMLEGKYQIAKFHISKLEFLEAKELLSSILNYKDSEEILHEAIKLTIGAYVDEGKFLEAAILLEELPVHEDLQKQIEAINAEAINFYMKGDFLKAKDIFKKLPDYKDSTFYLNKLTKLLEVQGTWKEEGNKTSYYVFNGWKYYRVTYPFDSIRIVEYEITENNVRGDTVAIYPEKNVSVTFNVFRHRFMQVEPGAKISTYKKISEKITIPEILDMITE